MFSDNYVTYNYVKFDNNLNLIQIPHMYKGYVLPIPIPNKNCLISFDVDDAYICDTSTWYLFRRAKFVDFANGFCTYISENGKRITIPREYVLVIPYNWYEMHKACRLGIETWLYFANRKGMCKDLRRLISQYIWKTRNYYSK